MKKSFVDSAKLLFLFIGLSSLICLQACDNKSSCRDCENGPPEVELTPSWQSNDAVQASFSAKNVNIQVLKAPIGGVIEGSSLAVVPGALSEDMLITLEEGASLINVATKLVDSSSSPEMVVAGPAIIVKSEMTSELTKPIRVSIPYIIDPTKSRANLVVFYKIFKFTDEGDGGKYFFGINERAVDSGTLEKARLTIETQFFGAFQAVYLSGQDAFPAEKETKGRILSKREEGQDTAPPSQFKIKVPEAATHINTPSLTWEASKGADSYDLIIALDRECKTIVQEYMDLKIALKTLNRLDDGEYFICLTAKNEFGFSSIASNNGASLVVDANPPGRFKITSPIKYANSATPVASWEASAGALRYLVSVMPSSDVECKSLPLQLYKTSDTSQPLAMLSDGLYKICVTAVDSVNHRTDADNQGTSFLVDTVPSNRFSIVSFGGVAKKLIWTPSTGASYYNVVIAEGVEGKTCSDLVKKSYEGIYATEKTLSGLEDSKNYRVCVTAVDDAGNKTAAVNSEDLFIWDIMPPNVLNVTSSTQDGIYTKGQEIDIRVVLSESVTVSGSPEIALNASSSAIARYSVMADKTTLVFKYTVQAGDDAADLDYVGIDSLLLKNGATIKDPSGNAAVITLPKPGTLCSLSANKNIVIDTVGPKILSVTSATPNGIYPALSDIDITVTFAEDLVFKNGAPFIYMQSGNTASADNKAYYISSSGKTMQFKYTVKTGDTNRDFDYKDINSLQLNGAVITDPVGNSIVATLPSPGYANSLSANKNIVIDGTSPAIEDVTSSVADGFYKEGQTIDIKVEFSENISMDGSTPELLLDIGTEGKKAAFFAASSDALTFKYIVQAGDSTAKLDYKSTSALVFSGSIKDAAGNKANLTLPTPGQVHSLAANKSIVLGTENLKLYVSLTTFSSDVYKLIVAKAAQKDGIWSSTEYDSASKASNHWISSRSAIALDRGDPHVTYIRTSTSNYSVASQRHLFLQGNWNLKDVYQIGAKERQSGGIVDLGFDSSKEPILFSIYRYYSGEDKLSYWRRNSSSGSYNYFSIGATLNGGEYLDVSSANSIDGVTRHVAFAAGKTEGKIKYLDLQVGGYGESVTLPEDCKHAPLVSLGSDPTSEKLTVVYLCMKNDEQCTIHSSTKVNGSWSDPADVGQALSAGCKVGVDVSYLKPSIAIDSNGDTHIAYIDAVNAKIFYSYKGVKEQVSESLAPKGDAHLVLDEANNQVHIIFRNASSEARMASKPIGRAKAWKLSSNKIATSVVGIGGGIVTWK